VTKAIRNSAALMPASGLLEFSLARIGSTGSDRSASTATIREARVNTKHPAEDANRQPVSDPSLRMHLTKQFVMA